MTRKGPTRDSAETIRRNVISCRRCKRLVAFREGLIPRRAYASQTYWRRPVPGFGDINGRLLILGLAPAASGGNRTGRVFTGDSSGRFLVRALYETGFANKPVSESLHDGLVYDGCYLTAAVKCAPPGDRPLPQEFENCSRYLDAEIGLMKNLRAVLALGSMAFNAYLGSLRRRGVEVKGAKFGHGKKYQLGESPTLYGSFHPSPRNTNTGKLTHEMLFGLLSTIRQELTDSR